MTVNAPGASQDLTQLISRAAQKTGADFDYLLNTAARESGFDPRAKAPTSSASGLFQFIDQTWLGMVKQHGAKHGMAAEAAKIEVSANGRYRVTDPAARDDILDMRFDPAKAAVMAGEYAGDAANALRNKLGREPDAGELYMAHFLGSKGAGDLILAAESNPDSRADSLFPAAARANRRLFTENGRPASVAELRNTLMHIGGAEGAPRAPSAPPPDAAFRSADVRREADWTAPPSRNLTRLASVPSAGPGRVLSPGTIEALAELDAPQRAKRKA
ncbi:MAG: transglycosylase SLT domain-containing protein [Euryhalocaulis sp.]|uniref:transglycosylase SLT domain-containing protein n=1 Tax=Euryhalocaulis sp. TaxID=2744307 RepID=UPI0018475C81|nr:transglycosylase SLT domain-containing protein [Euryhalocaulis sp.]MBA4802830.1 transglycosylase SLT domain-containing protein [Euryhalocaulis sp.]